MGLNRSLPYKNRSTYKPNRHRLFSQYYKEKLTNIWMNLLSSVQILVRQTTLFPLIRIGYQFADSMHLLYPIHFS